MSNFPSLAGRGVIVTGGNSGIGLAIAKTLVAAGSQVLISGRRAESNERALAEISTAIDEKGGSVRGFTGDMGDEQTVIQMVEEAEAAFGRLDAVVANAGGNDGQSAPLVEMDSAMWHHTIAANLHGPFYLFREAAKRMIAAGRGGSLIGMSSVSSIRITSSLHYSAAKGGMNALVTCIAGQLGEHGIRVNAILPGFIETPPVAAKLTSEAARQGAASRIPLKKIGAPDDIAGLTAFLASDEAKYITGQHIAVDGGLTKTM